MKKTVLLVYPKIEYEENYRYSWTPFSILALAGVLEREGYLPILFDQNSDLDVDLYSIIEPYLSEALCVGFSVMTGGGQIKNAIHLAEKIRASHPEMPLIWGGPHISALPQQTIRHPLVDVAVVGQGDITLSEIAAVIESRGDYNQVSGVYFKENSGEIAATSARQLTRKQDLPAYPWHMVNVSRYIRNDVTINDRTFGYVSSQGCPYRCRFCYEFGAYNAWWSAFDAQRLIGDVQSLVNEHNINGIKFYDADFFVNANRIQKFCVALQENEIPVRWAGSANPNDILRLVANKKHVLDLIRDTQCTRILMGMESGSDRILEMIDKRVTSKQLRDVARIIADYGIIGSFTFIVGFPDESREDLQATLDLIDYIHSLGGQHESRVHIFAPYPGTPLYEQALQSGFHPNENFEDWSDYNYYQPQTPWVNSEIVDIVREYTRMH